MDRFAMVLKSTRQFDRFVPVDNGCSDVYFVDMMGHPQKNEIKEGWFYNPEDNTFHGEDYITPVIEETMPTQLDIIEANTSYIAMMLQEV